MVDIALQVVGGEIAGNPNDLGDGVDKNDAEFGQHFPYLALPLSGSVEKSSPPAQSGKTLLTGGGDNTNGPSGDGFPAQDVGLIAVGLLALVAGGAAARRVRTAPVRAAVKAYSPRGAAVDGAAAPRDHRPNLVPCARPT